MQPYSAEDLSYNPNLNQNHVETLVNLINEFRCCFADNKENLGKTDILKMSINLIDDKPVVYRFKEKQCNLRIRFSSIKSNSSCKKEKWRV